MSGGGRDFPAGGDALSPRRHRCPPEMRDIYLPQTSELGSGTALKGDHDLFRFSLNSGHTEAKAARQFRAMNGLALMTNLSPF
jgi:hypothetical protein